MALGGLEFTGFVAVEPKSNCPHVQVSYFNFKYENEGHNHLRLTRKEYCAKMTIAKTFGLVTEAKRKNWPIADRRLPSNDPRSNCRTAFWLQSPSLF